MPDAGRVELRPPAESRFDLVRGTSVLGVL